MTKDISHTVHFNVSPHEVYEALMDSKKHAEFTGDEADISRKVGGEFHAYGGYIEGTNLELEVDKKIVQKWRASDWPEGHFSTASFILKKEGEGTLLEFTHTDVPSDKAKSIAKGWEEYYWEPMKDMLGK